MVFPLLVKLKFSSTLSVTICDLAYRMQTLEEIKLSAFTETRRNTVLVFHLID